MVFKNIFLCLLLCFFSSVSFAAGGKVFNKDYSKVKSLKAVIHVHEGKIVIDLNYKEAPNTVANFVELSNQGFYNGLVFHRVIPGFMIQGGDPSANDSGGSDKTIKGEFLANGVENNIKHELGVISMARTNVKDSATSQFFVCSANTPWLDGEYAAFGKTTDEESNKVLKIKYLIELFNSYFLNPASSACILRRDF